MGGMSFGSEVAVNVQFSMLCRALLLLFTALIPANKFQITQVKYIAGQFSACIYLLLRLAKNKINQRRQRTDIFVIFDLIKYSRIRKRKSLVAHRDEGNFHDRIYRNVLIKSRRNLEKSSYRGSQHSIRQEYRESC